MRTIVFNTGPKAIIICAALLFGSVAAIAQDTMRKKEVNITSTFKPTLKPANKINISAAPVNPDTSRPRLQYSIPTQNLQFAFQPGSLKPLALQIDSGGKWDNDSYVKAGYGNFRTPFFQTGISIGNGNTMGLNIFAKHYSSKGKIPFQELSYTNAEAEGYYQNSGTGEWNVRFGGTQEKFKRYGVVEDSVSPAFIEPLQYSTWKGKLGYRNTSKTEFGLSYAPQIRIDAFSDLRNNSESTLYTELPLRKTIGTAFEAAVTLEGNFTRYNPTGKEAISNNYFLVAPSVIYKSGNLSVNAGIKPSWDNSFFRVLPNVFAEFSSSNAHIAFQLGWVAHLRNTGFQYLANFNPWIVAPDSIYNTRIEERFAGIKGSIGDHFTYGVKAALNKVYNQPLFTNDTSLQNSFIISTEPQMNVFNIGGELGFTVGEKFSISSQMQLNKYSTKVNDKAWGLLPFEWRTQMTLQVAKDLYATAGFFAFDGAWARDNDGAQKLRGAMDLNAGLEFRIVKNFKLWAQFNNILNQEYQRWNHYPVLGFNFLGGIVFSFAQKN